MLKRKERGAHVFYAWAWASRIGMEHIKDVIARLFESQWGLNEVQTMSKGRGTEEGTYSPSVDFIMQLSNAVTAWEIDTEDLYDKRGYSVQLWTDKKTGKKLLVFFKRQNRKGVIPVLYVPLVAGQKPAAVLEEVLKQLFDAGVEKTLAA